MSGLDRHTFRVKSPEAHLAQSIGDILSTPIGSRVMRRTYGSNLPRLIDAPINGETIVDLFAATAEAIDIWEPRYQLRRVEITEQSAGRATLVLSGDVRGEPTVIEASVGRTQ